MSFPVKFFNYKKRENSTKVPNGNEISSGIGCDCTLLDNTSLMEPTFKISVNQNIIQYNYCYVPLFGGKNLFSYNLPIRDGYWDGSRVFHGTNNIKTIAQSTGWQYIRIPVIPGMTITGSNFDAVAGTSCVFLSSTNTSDVVDSFYSWNKNTTRVVPNNAIYLCICIRNIASAHTDFPNAQLEYGSTATSFFPWTGSIGRYYFINNISSDNNFWYVTCTCDVLATYRDTILSGSHYVLRSASAYDEYISDSAYISKMKETGEFATGSVDGTSATDPFSYSNGHSYVWCITADVIDGSLNNQQIGSNVYYWMDDVECYTFVDYLLNNVDTYSGINTSTEYSAAMQKALLNPMQYINSVVLLPFAKNDSLATNNDIKFGYYTVTLAGSPSPTVKRLTQGTMMKTQVLEITLPKHPQAASRGKYMNGSPYTSYELFLGAFGTIPIDPAPLIDETTLQVTCQTECCTGMTRILVRGKTSNAMIYTGTAQVGVPVTVSQLTRDMLGEVQNNLNMSWSTAGAMAGIVTGGIGATGSTFNAVQSIGAMAFDAVRMKYPTVTGGGSNSSFLSLHSTCYLNAKYYEIVGANNTEIGRPLYQTKTLSTLSGFTVCSGADVAITGTADEAEKINGYLNSGFFIE